MFRIKSIYAIVLALALYSVPAAGQKTKKVKEKRFEPVALTNLKDYEGTYVGIEPDYVIEVRVMADGQLKVQSLEDGSSVRLLNVDLKGAHLTADKVYADGSKGKFEATFCNRIRNGESVFGIQVTEGLRLETHGLTLTRIFYKRT